MSPAGNRKYFTGPEGVRVPAVTSDEMREVDRVAVQEKGPNLYQMMENAGRNLASLAIELLGSNWRVASYLVLAGASGNGGGGISAARHLANRGLQVRLCLAEPERLGEVPAFQRRIFQSTSGLEIPATNLKNERADIVLDALIGYGLKSFATGSAAKLIDWANTSGKPILALDVPSGTDATTGDAPGSAIKAKWTMTLALPKSGLLPLHSGQLFLADIGIPSGTYRRVGLSFTPPFGDKYVVRLF